MPHIDPDELAVVAMGDRSATAAEQQHLASCARCAPDLAELREVVALARTTTASDSLQPPPAHVWPAIIAQTAGPPPLQEAPAAELDDRRARRDRARRNWLPIGAAAAVGLVIGGVVTGAVTMNRSQPSDVNIMATADLTPLPDSPAPAVGSGKATIETVAGRAKLTLDTDGLARAQGFYEVWLLDPKTMGLVAIGTVGPGQQQAEFPIPEGVTMDQYPVVDVSDEPLDGDPTHSTVSVLRGQFTA
jgi:Anti-sigma-K factor rskA